MGKAETGKRGELAVARYLREHGYAVLTANYRCRFGEIDIIAEDETYICFVEVKTRGEGMRYAPADAVDARKRQRILTTAELYLAQNPSKNSRGSMLPRCLPKTGRLPKFTISEMHMTVMENEVFRFSLRYNRRMCQPKQTAFAK